MMRALLASLVLFACVSAAPGASAAEVPRPVIEHDLGQIIIEGKVPKPGVFYVLARSAFRYDGVRLRQSFVDRIVEGARKNQF